ncbi:MAG: hypothetical protein KDC67_10355 [Ignavibacteriae bacterium]|nr:hypothetical protein [Ignavibacteriota bacterium]
MKKATLLLVILLTVTSVFGQTNYTNGFNTGYKKGYCQDQGVGCIPPIPPIAPIPKIGESSDSYNDGYNRGFEMGLNARKSSNTSTNSTSSTNRTRYQTAKPKFVDFASGGYSNTDIINLKIKAISVISQRASENISNGNYDSAIEDANSLLKIQPNLALGYHIKSVAYYHKDRIIDAYNMAVKSDRIRGTQSEWRKDMFNEMTEYYKDMMSKNQYSNVIYVSENIWTPNNLTNYFHGLGYYFKGDYKKAKKYLKKVKGFEPAEQYLESIKNKKYYSNPYSNQNQTNNKSENSSNDNQFLSEVQKMYQRKEFNKLIDKLKPIEEKIRQKAITDKQTLFFTYSILAYSHYSKENLAETIKYSTLAIDNSVTKQNGDLYFLRGISKSNIGDYFGSNKDYDYLLENYKKINYDTNNLATLYNNKAYNLVLLKKYKESKPLIDKALSLDKNTDYIWGTKGELEYYLGNYSDAVNAMSKSIKINPTSNSYYYRGLAKIKLGNKESGCSDLSKAGEMGESKAYSAIKENCN